MLTRLMNYLKACFQPRSDGHVHASSDSCGKREGLLWYTNIGQHSNGQFSMVVVQAKNLLEDQSQIELGCLSTNELVHSEPLIIGVYDGHGGPETAWYINQYLFQHVKSKPLKF